MKRPKDMIPLQLIRSESGRVGVLFVYSHIDEDRKYRNEQKSRQKAKEKMIADGMGFIVKKSEKP